MSLEDRTPAHTIGELDIHLGYIQATLKEQSSMLLNMATKADIQQLREEFATKAELKRLEEKMTDGSTSSFFDKARNVFLFVLAFAGALGVLRELFRMFTR